MVKALAASIVLAAAFQVVMADNIHIFSTSGSLSIVENAQVTVGGVTEWQITLSVSNGANSANIFIQPQTSTNTYPIRYIKIKSIRNGTNTNNAAIHINQSEGGIISHIRSIKKISASPSADAEVWLTTLSIDGVLGDPGSPHTGDGVSADVVGTLDAAGGITANIVAGPRQFGGTSTISHIGTSGGAILGDITANYGQILEVLATSSTLGDIGSLTNPISIWANQAIGDVEANNIYASINATANSGAANVWYVKARTGDFYGELICNDLASNISSGGIEVHGTLGADVVIGHNMARHITANSIADGTVVNVGNILGNVVSLPASGLVGQVIAQGSLTSEVDVDGHHLSVADYEIASGDLGGGSFGVAPFQLNHQDCEPVSVCPATPCWSGLGVIGHDDFVANGIKLRFYGPISFGTGQRLHVYQANFWGIVPTSPVDYAVGSSDVSISLDTSSDIRAPRTVVIKGLSGGAIMAGTRLVIQQDGSGINCAQVSGTPAVSNFTYDVYIAPQGDGSHTGDYRCESIDFNCDGDAGTDADIEAFFACLAGSCPAAPCTSTADFNGDGDVGTDVDIEAFFRVLAGGVCMPY